MSDDYCSAARKHLDDARFLLKNGRIDNAGYLSGYVVECALKLLVQYSGGRPQRYGHDLSRLTGQALRLACYLNPSLRRYSLPPTQAVKALTDGWNPSLRYRVGGTISRTRTDACCRGRLFACSRRLPKWNSTRPGPNCHN